jgi:hypothetical protein
MAYPTSSLVITDRIGVEMMNKINTHFGDSSQHTGGGSAGPIESASAYGISTSNTAAQNRTGLLSLANTNKSVYFPAGDYQVDNAAGKLALGTFSGLLYFAPGARLVFNTNTKGGLNFGAGTRAVLVNVSLKYAAMPTQRLAGESILGFQNAINPLLINYRADGSPSIGVAFELCLRPRLVHAYITNTMADGCMMSNCHEPHITDYIAEDTGDDALSFVNHTTGSDYRGGYVSGITVRRGRARGIVVAGAKDITVENFFVVGTDGDGIIVAEDSTYSTRVPENITIRNGTVSGAGSISGLNLSEENGVSFSVVAGRSTIENVQIDHCADNGVYVAQMPAGSHLNISNTTAKDCGSKGFFCQINPSLHIENCRAIGCNSTGFSLLANYRLTFRNLSAINCSLTDTNRRGVHIGQVNYGGNTSSSAYVDGDGLQIYDDQDTPTCYRVFLEGITGFALAGDIGEVRSFCRTALPNYVISTSGANMGVTRKTTYAGAQSSKGTTAPTGGFWRAGDIVLHSTPTAGGNIGWVCTAQGNPGTWKAFGTIAT